MPDVIKIIQLLDKDLDPFTQNDDYYARVLAVSARIVQDKRGAQWLLSPTARIAVGGGEMADFHPQIWMIIQDSVLKYLSSPQLADLYLTPMSPKNPGEVQRKKSNPKLRYKRMVLVEALRRDKQPEKAANTMGDADIQQLFKRLIHSYKMDMQKLKTGQA